MLNIRPVSDLRNKYPELEKQLNETQEPIILTKNGVGAAVIMSIEEYERYKLTIEHDKLILDNNIDKMILESSIDAKNNQKRYTLDELFDEVDKRSNEIKRKIQNKSNKKFY